MLNGFLHQIPVGHVEAGLRTGNLRSPFPEEGFRKLIAPIATDHFAPTKQAAWNLVGEGVDETAIHATGNTVVDAIHMIAPTAQRPAELAEWPESHRMVLVTAHRRENWDEAMDEICAALIDLRNAHADIELVFPVHSNPRVRERVRDRLGGQARIHVLPAQPYSPFIWLMKSAHIILSDSGGVQEEAVTLGRPTLIMRDATERGEAVEIGAARLIGARRSDIVNASQTVLNDPVNHAAMLDKENPFGDGMASTRICEVICGDRKSAGKFAAA